jgi:hypothetical protein
LSIKVSPDAYHFDTDSWFPKVTRVQEPKQVNGEANGKVDVKTPKAISEKAQESTTSKVNGTKDNEDVKKEER